MTTMTVSRRPRRIVRGRHDLEASTSEIRTADSKTWIAPTYWRDVTRIIGIKSNGVETVVDQIRKGLPATTVQFLQREMDVTNGQFAATVNIPGRTLSRRLKEGRLRSDESERVVRIARLFIRAEHVLGDSQRARQWLKTPKTALAGKTPLDFADTEPGAEEVTNLLGRIEHGVFT